MKMCTENKLLQKVRRMERICQKENMYVDDPRDHIMNGTHLMINGVGDRVFITKKFVRSSLMPANTLDENGTMDPELTIKLPNGQPLRNFISQDNQVLPPQPLACQPRLYKLIQNQPTALPIMRPKQHTDGGQRIPSLTPSFSRVNIRLDGHHKYPRTGVVARIRFWL